MKGTKNNETTSVEALEFPKLDPFAVTPESQNSESLIEASKESIEDLVD